MVKGAQVSSGEYSVWQILDIANAYYVLSQQFTNALPRQMVEAAESVPEMGAPVASAMNRIFALELYLKGMVIAVKRPFPLVHDLVTLFHTLPEDIRLRIEEFYDERSQLNADPGLSWCISLYFKLGNKMDSKKTREEQQAAGVDPSLAGLLERNRGGFIASRYLFQNSKHDELSRYDYEYHRLAILCSILCEAIENSVPERPGRYTRTFNF